MCELDVSSVLLGVGSRSGFEITPGPEGNQRFPLARWSCHQQGRSGRAVKDGDGERRWCISAIRVFLFTLPRGHFLPLAVVGFSSALVLETGGEGGMIPPAALPLLLHLASQRFH
ncbi:hypothetical protein AOLI_G00000460 [Acnodon oligacanthus]